MVVRGIQASTLLTAGAIVYLTTMVYVLGTLTTALFISHSECHSLWWLVWFGVWLVAPLSRLGRDGANGGALLLYWDLAIFGSYWLLYAPLWTTLVCVVIAGLSLFYLLLSLTEAASAGDLYFQSEAQGAHRTHRTARTHPHTYAHAPTHHTRLACTALADWLRALGWTPLHMACYFGDEAVVRVLVSKQANVRATDRKSRRPIDVVPPDRQEAIAHALA